MTNSAVPVRSTRLRILAVVGALALGLGLVPAQAAFADTAGTLAGTVTVEGTGAPLAGANIFVQSGFTATSTLTAEDGSYSVTGLPLGNYFISVSAPGHVSFWNSGYELSEAAASLVVDFALRPIPTGDGTVSGIVFDKVTGVGIPGLQMYLQPDDIPVSPSTTTGADGGYTFTDLAPGGYRVGVFTGGLPYQLELVDTYVTVTEDQPDKILNIPLTPYASGTSQLTGSITDAQSGLPIDGASITLSGQTVVYSGGTTTSSGSYSIGDLAAGRYYVSVWAGGYLSAAAELEISDGSTATWDAAVIPLDAVITGRITDPSGSGVPDLWVGANGLQHGGSSALTDADGYYSITSIAAGDYEVWVGGPGTVWASQKVSTTAIADSEVTVDIQLVARTTSFVSSAVFDENHNGLQYICIDLVEAATGTVVESTESWVDAVFGFQEVADGTYTLHFEDCAVSRPRIFGSTYLGGGTTLADAETFTIDGPANDLRLDDILLAGPPTGWVYLVVTDSETGNPVTAPFTGYLEFDSTQYPISDWTESGALQLRDLQYGEYDFYVVAPGYAGRHVESVVVDATTPEHFIELELEPLTTGSITIGVTDSVSGAPIAGATATYTDAGGAHPVVDGDGDGVIALPDLAFGDYVVTVTAPGYLSAILASITIDSGDPDANAAARLVGVTVDDEDGHGHGKGHKHHGRGHGYGHDKH